MELQLKLWAVPTNDLTLKGFLHNVCFTYVEEEPFKEFLIDASQPGLKIFWNFYFKSLSADATIVSTETRILSLRPKTKHRFWVTGFL